MSADPRLILMLGEARYCLPVAKVSEVAQLRDLTPVPGQDKLLLGVVNLRGDIRPVIDLHTVLDLPPPTGGVRSWAIFLRHGAVEIGLRVDGVERLIGADEDVEVLDLPLDRLNSLACLQSRLPGKDVS